MPISEYLRGIRSKVGHELLLVPSVAMLVRDEKRGILLTKDSGFEDWSPPGGSVEPDESPREAAIREMKEETGLTVEPVRVLGVYGGKDFRVVYRNGDVVSYVTTAFECRVISGVLTPDHEEVLDARFFSEAEARSMRLSPMTRTILQDAFGRG